MDPLLAEKMLWSVTDDDAWVVAAAAATDSDPDVVAAVLAGDRPTTALDSERAAALCVERTSAFDRVREAYTAALDGREAVEDAVRARTTCQARERTTPGFTAAARALAAAVQCTDADRNRAAAAAAKHLASSDVAPDVAVAVISSVLNGDFIMGRFGRPDRSNKSLLGAAAHFVHYASDDQRAALLDAAKLDGPAGSALLAAFALAYTRNPHWGRAPGDFDRRRLLEARNWADSFRTKEVPTPHLRVRVEFVCELLECWMIRCGAPLTGPNSIAELLGFPARLDDCSAPQCADLVQRAGAAKSTEALDALAVAATANGVCIAPLSGFRISAASVGLSAAVALRAVPLSSASDAFTDEKSATELFEAITGRSGHRWDDAEVREALAARRALAEPLERLLPALVSNVGTLDGVPDWLLRASIKRLGLGVWLTRSPELRERLNCAAAGASRSQWTSILMLADGFSGTPEELVAVASEVSPDR